MSQKTPISTKAPAAMEKSEKEAIAPVSNGPDSSLSKEPELSIQSVGWLFVKKYYSTYATAIDSLYSFYDKKASLLHDGFPTSSDESVPKQARTVHVASGTDAIKTYYDSQSAGTEKSKIVIESADFQESVDNSILIVVCGSWKKGTSKLWLFLQTFVLTAKGKTLYDVSNDVLRFFDLSEDYQERKAVIEHQPVKAEETKSDGPVEAKVETKVDADIEVEANSVEKPESNVETNSSAAEEKTEETDPSPPAQDSEEPTETEVKPELTSQTTLNLTAQAQDTEDAATSKAFTETATAAEPEKAAVPHKQTWATLAAIEPKTSSKVASVTLSTTVVKTSPPPVVKAGSPSQQAASNGAKFKKDEWYPIYIKNVEVTDDDLRNALIKQFGDIKFYRRSNKAALVDFKNKSDQQKALDAKEINVKGNQILLEPRLNKSFNNNKPDGKKDKKPVKKAGIKKN